MFRLITASASGLIFGIGLSISGMVNPAKVKNFLDIAGTWDTSLLFVMLGAICVTLPGYRWLRGKDSPWFSEAFQWPTRSDVDSRLLIGAVMFGLGWAISGLCPGPALAVLPTAIPGVIGFVVMMVVGAVVSHHQTRINNAAS